MGKGTINSHIGNGQYNVTLNQDTSRVTLWITELTDQIANWIAKIAGMPTGTEKNLAILKKTALEKRKAYLEANTPVDPGINAWCTDFTKDLSGSVGTIEVPGERGTVLIQPGYGGNAVYDSNRDGQLQPIIASTPECVFYNFFMLPGWQKWKPTFRFGTITAIDYQADTCSINLEPAISSAQGLDINQTATLSGVPIDYMNCNAAAFEVGNDVLVEFEGQDWASPKVVGFKESPKACGFEFTMTRADGSQLTSAYDLIFTFRNKNMQVVFSGGISGGNVTVAGNVWSISTGGFSDGGADADGYWMNVTPSMANHYCIEDMQYPSRYKTADKYQAGDRITAGEYSMELEYWRIGDTGWSNEIGGVPDDYSGASVANMVAGKTRELYLESGGTLDLQKTIYSSVPYRYSRMASEPTGVGVVNHTMWPLYHICVESDPPTPEGDYFAQSIPGGSFVLWPSDEVIDHVFWY